MDEQKGDPPAFLFAGDRALAVSALRFLISDFEHLPRALCVSDRPGASHAAELERVFRNAGGTTVIPSSDLNTDSGVARLRDLSLDFALSVHFPELVKRQALDTVRLEWLNLHPAYLPFNRGWHTPSWAILEGTPAGATIHVMVEDVDAGPILAQRVVDIRPDDTAHSLYQRLLVAELDLLRNSWPMIASGEWDLTENTTQAGTAHRKADLFNPEVQRLELDSPTTVGALLDRLRALTTNDPSEAAYFDQDDTRYRIRVQIEAEGQPE